MATFGYPFLQIRLFVTRFWIDMCDYLLLAIAKKVYHTEQYAIWGFKRQFRISKHLFLP